jgi:hypothetical protein
MVALGVVILAVLQEGALGAPAAVFRQVTCKYKGRTAAAASRLQMALPWAAMGRLPFLVAARQVE